MAARAATLGDWGDSAPEHWLPWFRPGQPVHLVATMHADTVELLERHEQAMMSGPGGRAVRIRGRNEGASFEGDLVHFGYRDNISQPRFAGIHAPQKYDDQPLAPLGTVLLGHPTAFEQLTWTLPDPPVLGLNGAFNAYRVLEQDVAGFEAFLDQAAEQLLGTPAAGELLPPGSGETASTAARHVAMREVVASRLCGRWRTGTPLSLSPRDPSPSPPVSDTDFDYADDPDGLKCPVSSHARRANPRGGKIVQRIANYTRRLVRRGIPYGPWFDPSRPDGIERGLLGNFLCADLSAQFEAVQYDWLNLGLQDPRITGSNDPLLGANEPDASWFDLPASQGAIRLRGLPRFVRTRGGAYTFLPSLGALRWIGSS
jgi:deferrochelatase/peroxidase EfeB